MDDKTKQPPQGQVCPECRHSGPMLRQTGTCQTCGNCGAGIGGCP